MKKSIYLLLPFFLFSVALHAQKMNNPNDEAAIKLLLEQQKTAWNNGDLTGYMQGYWHNDSLMFIGKSGITYGWENTLNNYKKGYTDTASMGKLFFELLHLQQVDKNNFFVVGKWYLTRSMGNLKGAFTLLLKKINNTWVIIADHSS
jgi:ketosteroid isomerase-like protein